MSNTLSTSVEAIWNGGGGEAVQQRGPAPTLRGSVGEPAELAPDDRAVMILLISDISCEWNGSSLGSGKHIDCNIVLGDSNFKKMGNVDMFQPNQLSLKINMQLACNVNRK